MPLPQAEALPFRKSSYSSAKGQNCVEVADTPGTSAVRDSQNPDSGHLTFSSSEWTALLATTRRTEAHHA
ncbi:DUF397 domain-containing protein [Nocardiopsis alba]|uniref:DUF397 domain-containing protein n=1 Tax=Nocardiopsis alba TaxID=53437 RepID=A0A7K2IR79_9ACTN|nr:MULTISPECIES: DUF397 domain-containing protein [Nocardiopsis]MEC3892662.1 DUF397 domain-containing protein [Nocardiopsis sp. LDBS1602]MYR32413.1 DUF397 domain-containing protein [Nocardiopsis alba]